MMKSLNLKLGKNHTSESLIKLLNEFNYERVETLEYSGQYTVKGGNFLIFPVLDVEPVRVEFFGNEIERIQHVKISDGRAVDSKESIEIRPNVVILSDSSRIKPGDYIVHQDHGIGIFSHFAMKEVSINGVMEAKPYIVIEYLNSDRLYLPLEQREMMSPYIGVGSRRPKLNKLGTQTWKRTYKRTYENVLLLAKELLLIYAKRELSKRQPITINKEWDAELAHTFGYRETEDQVNAIREVYNDLGKDHPMDRLVCGDVGYGKTEVAIRAMAQEVQGGNQVALLVPTTILAEQHYAVLTERFKNLPVVIKRLSRFTGNTEEREIFHLVESGAVDIIVGTHKLFSKNLKFKNLGMLVIDEEQKFGVKDKERLKKIRSNINVLSLTATPIPRTLFMSLSGIRDLSQINTPPRGRKEIQTVVDIYNKEKVALAINREVKRGGQVYYLHNEVSTIGGTRNKLQKIFPKLKIKVAHGQQSEELLAGTMSAFTRGEIDILVCSTIIENGLDLPNVNTLVVESADRFGLSQLYQIRGRIGRSNKQAYALFTHNQKKITDDAFKRFKALVENTELGSGYNIALSDLEIRGGGNILGREQHGSMEAVGLLLYSKLLNQAVKMVQAKQMREKIV